MLCSCSQVSVSESSEGNGNTAQNTLEEEIDASESIPTDRLSAEREAARAALSAVPTVDFEGMSFIITSNSEKRLFGDGEEQTVLSKEKNNSLREISERLNVNIISAEDSTDIIIKSLKDTQNAETVYTHLLLTKQGSVGTLVYEGLIGNIDTLPFVDTQKPYYNADFCESTKTPSGLYSLYGEILSEYDTMTVTFYNEALAEKLGAGDIYELVGEGQWSYDKMNELSLSASALSSGELKLYGTLSSDKSGLISSAYTSVGAKSVSLNGSSLSVNDNNDVLDAVSGKIHALLTSDSYCEGEGEVGARELFVSGRGLFYTAPLGYVKEIYNMADVWGVLPLPTASGDGHVLSHGKNTSVLSYPKNATDLGEVGALVESIFASGYKITDAAYADTFFHQYARSERAVDMLIYLMGKSSSDFALLYSDEFQNFGKATLGAFSSACQGEGEYSTLFNLSKNAANRSLGYIK